MATTTGAGPTIDLGGIRRNFKLSWTSTGSPATVAINLEASTDATTWVTIATSSWPTTPDKVQVAVAGTSVVPGDLVTTRSAGFRYVRYNVTALSPQGSQAVFPIVGPISSGDING